MKLRHLLTQTAIAIVTGVAVAFVVEHWRERRALAPLPQSPVSGADKV